MRTLKVTVSYDGTEFSGFQRQANARSVQAELEIALAAIEGKHVTLAGTPVPDEKIYAFEAGSGDTAAALVDLAGPRANQISLDARLTMLSYAG